MPRAKSKTEFPEVVPMLKTVEQMSRISGIGITRLRQLIDKKEVEYVLNGNRALLTEEAILDWYKRNSIKPNDKSQRER